MSNIYFLHKQIGLEIINLFAYAKAVQIKLKDVIY